MNKKGILYLRLFSFIFTIMCVTPVNFAKSDETPSDTSVGKKCENAIDLAWNLRNSEPHKAKSFLQKSILTCKKTGNYKLLAKAYNIWGVLYRNISEYDSSYYKYKAALRYALLANDSIQIGYAYNNISGYYGYKNHLYLSLEYAYLAADIFRKINHKPGMAYAAVEIGLAYYYLKDYEKSEKYFKDVVKIRKESSDVEGTALAYVFLGAVALEQKKLTEAKKYLFIGYKFFVNEKNNKKGLGAVLWRLAEIDCLENKNDIALKKYYNALSNSKQAKYYPDIVNSYLGLSRCYYKKGKIDSTFHYLDLAYNLANEKNYKIGFDKTLEQFYRTYSAIGNIKKTAYYFKQLLKLRDSYYRKVTLMRNEEFREISKIRDLEEKNIKLRIEVKKKRLLISLVWISLFLLFAFLIIVFIQNKKIRYQGLQLSKTLEEKDKLMSIIANDLRNPFSSLLSYADYLLGELNRDYNIEEIKNGVSHMRGSAYNLLEMVENLLYWARLQTGRVQFNPANYKIAEIIEEAANYFKQSMTSKGITLEADVNPNYECYCDKELLTVILRNLISDSVKFSNAGDKIKIYAEAVPERNSINIIIENAGEGMTNENLAGIFSYNFSGNNDRSKAELGMLLVKEMTEINKGKIRIDSETEEEVKVVLSFPMRKD